MKNISELDFVITQPDYEEEYRPVTYPNVKQGLYLISNYGNIVNAKTDKIMKTYKDKDGYSRITLVTNEKQTNPKKRGNKQKHFAIHRLVGWEFLGNPPDEKHNVINHINGIVSCNYVHNLEWTDVLGNTNHAKDTGLMNNSGLNSANNKYPEDMIRNICSLLESGYDNVAIFKRITNEDDYKKSGTNRGIYMLINKLSKRIIYRDIVTEYNYLPDISYFYCDKKIGKVREMIYRGCDNYDILNAFGYNDVSDNVTFYNRIISERVKCEVLFNDYRKESLEEISKLITE